MVITGNLLQGEKYTILLFCIDTEWEEFEKIPKGMIYNPEE